MNNGILDVTYLSVKIGKLTLHSHTTSDLTCGFDNTQTSQHPVQGDINCLFHAAAPLLPPDSHLSLVSLLNTHSFSQEPHGFLCDSSQHRCMSLMFSCCLQPKQKDSSGSRWIIRIQDHTWVLEQCQIPVIFSIRFPVSLALQIRTHPHYEWHSSKPPSLCSKVNS